MFDNKPLIIANHKANFTWEQLEDWIEKISPALRDFSGTVVIAPAQAHLTALAQKIKSENLNLKLSAQNISVYPAGAYTGEVAASQIEGIASYALVGHSERRNYFGETDETSAQKIQKALQSKITPIFCVQDENNKIPERVEIIAYEPPAAIGSGNPENPQAVRQMVTLLKSRAPYTVIYGGSVSAQNVKSLLEEGTLDGVLIGTDSLDVGKFTQILNSIQS